jgi:hypothetical protein
VGRHASSTARPASVRGVPLVGRPGPAEGARHAGPPPRERERGRGAGVLTGFALLAGAVFGTAAVQTAAVQTAAVPEPPMLAGPAAPLDPAAVRPAGLGPSSAPRPVPGSTPSPRTRAMPVALGGGVGPAAAPPRP